MKTINNKVYPDNMAQLITVKSVRPLPDYRLSLRFIDDERRTFDMTPLLSMPCYKPLQDPQTFAAVYLEDGIPTWLDGEVDIAPETLYFQGTNP